MNSEAQLDDLWNDFYTSVNLKEEKKKCEQKSNNCKHCNQEDSFVILEGSVTCTDCGYIFQTCVISDDPEWTNSSEDGIPGSLMRCGNVLDPTNPYDTGSEFLPKYHWTWHLDSEGNKRYTNLSRLAIRVSYTSKQRAFDEAKYSFEKIQERLALSEGVFNAAKLFWGIILKTDILKRGGNRRGMKACCIFYACLSEKQQRNREDIAAAFDIDHSADFTKGEKIFREIFEKNPNYSWILFKGCENESMYSRYTSQLGLPIKVNKLMIQVKQDTREHLLGIAAKSEIAGILYYVVKDILNLKHPNKSEIAGCIGICNPTLNKVIEILKYFYNLNPELKKKLL
jgi:transcription initiation factor TFIIIB Brf1 subunit/transcription initiation factor TFIIB